MKKVLYILGKLNEGDIDWMVENGTRQAIQAGTALVREKEAVEQFYILLDGKFNVISHRMPVLLNTLGAGEVVGELSFLDSRPPAATVVAAEDSNVLSIPRSVLQSKLETDVAFGARFYHALGAFLADRLRGTVQLMGYDDTVKISADEEYQDELDDDALDEMALAGSRFDWMLQRLRGH